MRSFLIAAVGGLMLAGSAAATETPVRPSYNMQSASEDIGPFAGGAKVHRASAALPAQAAKPHRARRRH